MPACRLAYRHRSCGDMVPDVRNVLHLSFALRPHSTPYIRSSYRYHHHNIGGWLTLVTYSDVIAHQYVQLE